MRASNYTAHIIPNNMTLNFYAIDDRFLLPFSTWSTKAGMLIRQPEADAASVAEGRRSRRIVGTSEDAGPPRRRHIRTLPLLLFPGGGHRNESGREVGAVRGVLRSMTALLGDGATHVGVATDHVIDRFETTYGPGTRPATLSTPICTNSSNCWKKC